MRLCWRYKHIIREEFYPSRNREPKTRFSVCRKYYPTSRNPKFLRKIQSRIDVFYMENACQFTYDHETCGSNSMILLRVMDKTLRHIAYDLGMLWFLKSTMPSAGQVLWDGDFLTHWMIWRGNGRRKWGNSERNTGISRCPSTLIIKRIASNGETKEKTQESEMNCSQRRAIFQAKETCSWIIYPFDVALGFTLGIKDVMYGWEEDYTEEEFPEDWLRSRRGKDNIYAAHSPDIDHSHERNVWITFWMNGDVCTTGELQCKCHILKGRSEEILYADYIDWQHYIWI